MSGEILPHTLGESSTWMGKGSWLLTGKEFAVRSNKCQQERDSLKRVVAMVSSCADSRAQGRTEGKKQSPLNCLVQDKSLANSQSQGRLASSVRLICMVRDLCPYHPRIWGVTEHWRWWDYVRGLPLPCCSDIKQRQREKDGVSVRKLNETAKWQRCLPPEVEVSEFFLIFVLKRNSEMKRNGLMQRESLFARSDTLRRGCGGPQRRGVLWACGFIGPFG